MKNIFLVLLIVCISAISLFGDTQEEAVSPFGIDVSTYGSGEFGNNIWPEYGSESTTIVNGIEAIVNFLTAFKLGAMGDFYYQINDIVSVGAQVGFAFFTTTELTPYMDIPVRAMGRFTIPDTDIVAKAYAGYNFATTYDITETSTIGIRNKIDLGASFTFGNFITGYSYLFWWDRGYYQDSHRFVLGYEFKVL